jgi:hypothetical protein
MNKAFLEFINDIERSRLELRCSNSGAFYRGHSNGQHKLTPSLLRNDFTIEKEHNLYVDSFIRSNSPMEKSKNSWEFLSIMQHFGIPTRLLDWTESLATAIYFALLGNYQNPKIWITNPFELNKANKASKKPRILCIGLDDFPDYKDCFVKLNNKEKWLYEKPVFVQIPWLNKRISNQKGFFTIHTTSEPMEENSKKFVRCVPIKDEAILGAKKFLEYAGVNEETIFPDLDGFGRFLKKRYKM